MPFGFTLISAFVELDEIILEVKTRKSTRIVPVPLARSSKLLLDSVVDIKLVLINIYLL